MKSRAAILLALGACLAGSTAVCADDLRTFVRGSWKAIQEEHRGRAFVAHFWGLTCGPCRVELPEWGQLAAERKDLDLVTINADLVAGAPAASQSFLKQAGLLNAENWLFSNQFQQRLRYEVNPEWQGEIPATVLFDRTGAATWLDGAVDFDRVRAWLDEQSKTGSSGTN
jgi:thiol-disulfide isomerase/thioredoxin